MQDKVRKPKAASAQASPKGDLDPQWRWDRALPRPAT